MLLPTAVSAVGQRVRAWLQEQGLRPVIVGEFDDSALAQEFGRKGVGFYVGPAVLAHGIVEQTGMQLIGQVDSLRAEFYAISIERRIRHRGVAAITQAARSLLS